MVAKEVREFLEHTNLGTEMQKMLTTVQFEINTTIRFKPNDGSSEPRRGRRREDPQARGEVGRQVKRPDERPRERRAAANDARQHAE